MTKGPCCPACGSTDMILPAFTHFRWWRGRWVEAKGKAEIADGAPMNCQDCGKAWHTDDLDGSFDNLVEDVFRA